MDGNMMFSTKVCNDSSADFVELIHTNEIGYHRICDKYASKGAKMEGLPQ